jgi:hypothetical protein
MEDDIPGWEGLDRGDAMMVAKTAEATWIIMPPDARPVIRFCPCCTRPFRTAFAAKRTADALYPADRPVPRPPGRAAGTTPDG